MARKSRQQRIADLRAKIHDKEVEIGNLISSNGQAEYDIEDLRKKIKRYEESDSDNEDLIQVHKATLKSERKKLRKDEKSLEKAQEDLKKLQARWENYRRKHYVD